jgi:O-antigen/teichoic acid export membrane protein
MQKRQTLINAFMSVIQIFIISAVLFVLYKFLLNTIGVEQLGVWSLVLATTSVSQIASFGLSGSVVKFVAKYRAKEDVKSVSEVIQTTVLSVGIIVAVILLIFFPLIKWILQLVMPESSFSLALSILPYALFAFWIMTVTSIFQSGLDGYQRIDIRSTLLMGGAIFHLLLCFLLVPLHGLLGLAYAKVIQNIVVLCFSWIMLRKYIKRIPIIPLKWNKKLFKEIIGYGVNFQIISIMRMLYDPVTKSLLSKFGGLPMVGYYEMSSKMIRQFRALIVSANQVLVPVIADLQEKISERIKSVYLTSYRLLFYLGVSLYSLIIISAPIISKIWIGHHESIFVLFTILLSIGWFLNTLNAPAYFIYLGTGNLRWNVISHIAIALLNVGLGFLLGIFYGGIGVVIAWIISLSLGSSIIYLSYHIKYKISLIELLPKASRAIFIVCLIGILTTLMVYNVFMVNTMVLNSIIIFAFSIILFIFLWFHPMRKRLMGWINNELLNKGSRSTTNR